MKYLINIQILIFCLIAANSYASPYPISPRPLRKLVMESSVIITGDVVKIYTKESKKKKKNISYESYHYAKIVIRECLQGKVKDDTIEVPFNPNMACPAPPRYYEKTTVLAFLDVEKGNYSTHALSYGAKTMDNDGINIYKQRILEIQNIQRINDESLKKVQTIEWLVKCAENPITRYEGIFELSPKSNLMSFYSQNTITNNTSSLTAQQKARLKNALLSSNDFDYDNFGLSDLIYNEYKNEIDQFLLEKLKTLDSKNYWYASEFMKRLKHLGSSPEIENLLKRQDELDSEYNKESEQKILIDQFVTLTERH